MSEAAERLRKAINDHATGIENKRLVLTLWADLDAALAAERRATVEKVKAHAKGLLMAGDANRVVVPLYKIMDFLDEMAK